MKCIGTLSVLKQSKERTDTAAKRVRISRGYLLTVDKNQYGPKELIYYTHINVVSILAYNKLSHYGQVP